MSVGKMCRGCPFWRRSVPAVFAIDHGVLARAAAAGIANDLPLACIEGEAPHDVRACVGSLIFRKNADLVWDLHPDEHRALEMVECNPAAVFTSWHEYQVHHQCAD